MRRVLQRIVAVVLFDALLAASPLHADEFPVGCVFYKASATGYQGEQVQFLPGEKFSVAVINDGYGKKPTYCLYSIETTPYSLRCQGQGVETFSFVGPTWDVQTHDILVFRNTAWYKRCFKPV